MQNAEMEQILALMNQYAAVLITLNERGVIRTYNSPVGDFAEWLVSQKLGLRLEKNSARGLDATGSGMHLHRESSRFSPCTARGFLLYYGQKGQRP